MKRVLCAVIALAMICLSTACLAEAAGADFLGRWACDRAVLTVSDEHPGYRVEIQWGGSAWESAEWAYYCPYALSDGSLVSEPTGIRRNVTYGEDGEIVKDDTVYEDGEAAFSIDAEGRLHWADAKEDAGADMAFEAVPMIDYAPTAEEFRISYFGMIGDAELSLDKKACEALNFAAASELWLADVEVMRANLLEAWEGLSGEAQSAFDASFIDVARLLDACFEDWPANRAAFQDGRDERMDEMVNVQRYREAWQTLFGNTLTMGNSGD